ncbi:alpha/beta fold hydrolase [Tistrella bauzanensis]|uniref:alpha/beta fold hydrolase n=1 Tax=Tistrella TaxID=171436 RepID=UPI0031F6057A
MVEITHRRVNVGEVTLHIAEAGDPEKPVMLFLHGFPEFWYAWKGMMGRFAADYRCVAPDLRGFGESDAPAEVEAYRAKHVVGDIKGLIEALGVAKVILVAHDWGGAAAWLFAMSFPQMIERLIILNSPHPATFQRELTRNPDQIRASQYFRLFRSPEAEAKLSANDFDWLWRFSMKPVYEKGILNDADKAAYLEAWGRPGALTGGLNWYRASPIDVVPAGTLPAEKPLLDPAKYAVTLPVLVIWGLGDTALVPGLIEGLEIWVPNVTIERVQHATHWIAHEAPDEVEAAIRRFLATKPTTGK